MLRFQKLILSLGITLTAAACGGGSDSRELMLSFENLPDAGPDHVYEGWVIVDGEPVSTGRFEVTENGALSPQSFELEGDLVDAAAKFVLTIEPATGDDPAPSAVHILAGPIQDGVAELSMSDGAALGTDFAEAAGDYVLATPTTANDTSDNDQGIWWLSPGMPPEASLSLPELPQGWVYEGWVVGPDGPISTGRFTDPAAEDGDGAGADAGSDGAPPFPGQDFIDPALVLDDAFKAVITVEPEPDTAAAPFTLKPLVDDSIESVAFPNGQSMANRAAMTRTTGSAEFVAN